MLQYQTLRKGRKLSQQALAIRMNVSQTAVSQWESGKSSPDVATLIRLADFYQVSIDYILGRSTVAELATTHPQQNERLSDFERKLLSAFRALPAVEQTVVCRSIGIEHPAARRAEIKQA